MESVIVFRRGGMRGEDEGRQGLLTQVYCIWIIPRRYNAFLQPRAGFKPAPTKANPGKGYSVKDTSQISVGAGF